MNTCIMHIIICLNVCWPICLLFKLGDLFAVFLLKYLKLILHSTMSHWLIFRTTQDVYIYTLMMQRVMIA